ncbi:MAG TPA: hypothetical protein VNZ26_21300 [Vicinamibacterales bacterium]|nr:hypothetical protein [Vicinamibacterales bacterium]
MTHERLPDGRAKIRILRAVDRARAFVPLRAVLWFLRLSPSRFHMLTTALKACQAGPAAVPVGSAVRQDALAALHAVESAVNGGANVAAFKKYQLDAKIKVDAFPATPENARLQHVSQIYVDASRLMTASQTQTLRADEVKYFKAQYGSLGVKPLNDLPYDGIDSDRQTSLNVQLGANAARFAGMGLLQLASSELQKVTTAATILTPPPPSAASTTHPANWNQMTADGQAAWIRCQSLSGAAHYECTHK